MRTAIAALALAVVAAAPASAMLSNSAAQTKIQRFAPDVDVSTLSSAQVSTLLNAISSNDSNGDRRAAVRSLVRQYQ